ncbi:unnamed protein product [Trichobilharzia regenti]|nr:unnamed protein product [Trichobilharzia regenti]
MQSLQCNKLSCIHHQLALARRIFLGSCLIVAIILLHCLIFPVNEYKGFKIQFPVKNQFNGVNTVCENLFENRSHVYTEGIQSKWSGRPLNLTNPSECEEFKLYDGYTVHPSVEEEQFPLAFSLAVHDNIKQVSRLLRLIHRQHNLYCIHVDSKSPQSFYNEVLALVKCFGPNVMVVKRSESIDVQWGHYSILEVFLLCADKLMNKTEYKWKYILNVSGQELPLRTNWELVAALKAINGSNIVECLGPRHNPSRWPVKKLSFPVVWSKGSFYMALKREFVHFYQTDPKAKEILDAMKSEKNLQKHPDELFFSTLSYNPQLGAPGASNLLPTNDSLHTRSAFASRYVTWGIKSCLSGRVRRGVCIMGVMHLPYIPKRMEFFVNKFLEDFQPIAYDCTEYYIMRKTIKEMQTQQIDPNFDISFYSRLYQAKSHI